MDAERDGYEIGLVDAASKGRKRRCNENGGGGAGCDFVTRRVRNWALPK